MGSLEISGIIFACVFGGTLLGIILRAVLPEQHLTSESKDVVKLGMGLIGTMTALVLGLMIASAKSSFDTQRAGVAQLAGNVIIIDRALAHYGPEATNVREMLRASAADLLVRTWPGENRSPGQDASQGGTEGKYEFLIDKIQALPAKTGTAAHVPGSGRLDRHGHGQAPLDAVFAEGQFDPTAFFGGDGSLAGPAFCQFQPLCPA